MKAIVQDAYGGPETLALEDIDAPEIRGPKDVLVRVKAASLNAADWHSMTGRPVFIRIGMGLRRPDPRVKGMDVAGVVEAVGSAVSRVRPGDEVFGIGKQGTFAQLAIVPEDGLARKPTRMGFEEASTLGIAALTALQGLRDKARLRAGERVLVCGAGGGVGTFTVQLAKAMGAHVTALTSGGKLTTMREIGADAAIDYAQADALAGPGRYDVVFDLSGDRRLDELQRLLTPSGRLVLTGAGTRHGMGLVARPFSGLFARRAIVFVAKSGPADLDALAAFAQEGKVRGVIDRTYALEEAQEAMRALGAGKVRGKLVLRVG